MALWPHQFTGRSLEDVTSAAHPPVSLMNLLPRNATGGFSEMSKNTTDTYHSQFNTGITFL